jgi:hypothetical protein
MKMHLSAAIVLLFAGLAAGAAQAQAQQPQPQPVRAGERAAADATANVPPRSGEASTMTNGAPNLRASNVQPGEPGIQSRLVVRGTAPAYGGDPGLKMMGAPGLVRTVLISPP